MLGGALYSYLPPHDAYTILTLPLIAVVLGLTAFLLPLNNHLLPSFWARRPRAVGGRAQQQQQGSTITTSSSSSSSAGSVDGGASSSMLVRLGGQEQGPGQRLELVVLREEGEGEGEDGDEGDSDGEYEEEEERKERRGNGGGGDAASVVSSSCSSSSAALSSLATAGGAAGPESVSGGGSGGGVRVWTDPTVALIALAITLTFASQGFLALSFGVHTRNVLGLSR